MGNSSAEKFEITVISPVLGSVMLIGMSAFTIVIALGFSAIRKLIHKDGENLDVAFDAGGKASIGLTATTIVSQWTWAATLLKSAAVAAKYGISGPFWYAAGATVQLLLFSVLSVKLKTHAPGAKTFLQVIRGRFGNTAHKIYCVYALLTNLIVMGMLMLGGAEVIVSLIEGFSMEIVTILCCMTIFAYTLIGGLGATFYASYFNTAFTFIGIMAFCYNIYWGVNKDKGLGSIENMYKMVQGLKGPEGNAGRSYLTLASKEGFMFGIINIIGNFGTVLVDQSYWQSSVAAKPKEGVFGFLIGGLVWFSVPFTFATATGLAYLAIGSNEGGPILAESQVEEGQVPAAVASYIGGYSLHIILLIMILMAVTSTGSAEVVAISSILVYDIYMIYLKPFRATFDANTCILCGKAQGRKASSMDGCNCESTNTCKTCNDDTHTRNAVKRALKPPYSCKIHGQYRRYQDVLGSKKSWCLLWSSMLMIPLTFTLKLAGITLGWIYMFMGVLIGSAVIPVGLCLIWDRLTTNGMCAGPICGTFLGIMAWLITGQTHSGGLSHFFTNTGSEWSMLIGNVVSLGAGGVISVIVSYIDSRTMGKLEKEEIWEATLDIDNPIYSWTELYKKELNLKNAHKLDNRPSLVDIEKTFASARKVAVWGSLVLTIILLVIWPGAAAAVGVFSLNQFQAWIVVSIVWGILAGLCIIIIPVFGEIRSSIDAIREGRLVHSAATSAEQYSNI